MRILGLLLAFAMASDAAAQASSDCTLLVDLRTAHVVLEKGNCTAPVTPASSFKIPLAVMAYDAGILTDAAHPVMRFQAGDPDWGGPDWRRDTDPAHWMRHSVLWYSQRIAHALGQAALTRYARSFGYGNADFSGDPGLDNGLDRAWIASSLQISPRQQAGFLRALVLDALPVDPDAMAKARMIVEPRHVGDWVLHGKTGTAYPRRADRSFDYARGWGWYVGWARMDDRALVFVRLTQTTERGSVSPGHRTRDEFIAQWADLALQ